MTNFEIVQIDVESIKFKVEQPELTDRLQEFTQRQLEAEQAIHENKERLKQKEEEAQ